MLSFGLELRNKFCVCGQRGRKNIVSVPPVAHSSTFNLPIIIHLRHFTCLFFRIKSRALSKEMRDIKIRDYLQLDFCFLCVESKTQQNQGGRKSFSGNSKYKSTILSLPPLSQEICMEKSEQYSTVQMKEEVFASQVT